MHGLQPVVGIVVTRQLQYVSLSLCRMAVSPGQHENSAPRHAITVEARAGGLSAGRDMY